MKQVSNTFFIFFGISIIPSFKTLGLSFFGPILSFCLERKSIIVCSLKIEKHILVGKKSRL